MILAASPKRSLRGQHYTQDLIDSGSLGFPSLLASVPCPVESWAFSKTTAMPDGLLGLPQDRDRPRLSQLGEVMTFVFFPDTQGLWGICCNNILLHKQWLVGF